MLRKRFKNPIFLIYVLVGYVTIQFSWWLYLIFSLYRKLYNNSEILEKKTWMLLGEGAVFFLILILGILIILRAFKYERELIRQQENFVLSVTHELKTPLSTVKLILQTLKKRNLPEEKTQDMYDQSLIEINRLDSLVNNLLLTRSIENNNFFLDKTNVNLSAFIQEVSEQLQHSVLKFHTVKLDLENIELNVDKIGFQSILVNLLENASKYSPKGTEINIKLYRNNDTVQLEVSDRGIGIPKEHKSAVLGKFYRDENEMTRKSKGTGLGLYIANFIVKQHDGEIKLLDNEPSGLLVKIQFKK